MTPGLHIPSVTIRELLKAGFPAVVVRCLHRLCRGEAVIRLASFPVELHQTDQGLIDWACVHCGRAQVVVEQPVARHRRHRLITLGEMRQAVRESAEAYMPCRPRQVVIEDRVSCGPVVRPRTDGAFEGLDRILAGRGL